MIDIRRYVSGLLSSNMYVVIEDGHALVIDPFEDLSPVEGLIVDYVFLTHEHYDHISGVNYYKEKVGAPVLCSRKCGENIKNPKKSLASHFGDFCEIQTWIHLDNIPQCNESYSCSADIVFDDTMYIDWQGHSIKLFEIPGHSMGSIGILFDNQAFFSGDSLMENFDIELRIPGGSKKLWKEIGFPRISSLPSGIMIYPGHFDKFIYQR